MAFRRANIECLDCEHHQFEPKIIHKSSGLYDKHHKPISCTICGSENMKTLKREEEFGAPAFGKFASSTPEERSQMLKKRSRDHYQSKIKDKAIEMNRNPLKYGFE